MNYQKDRDEFIAIASQEGLSLDIARKILRHAQTLHRLAVAQCNGDWPAANGERKVEFCPRCESGFVPSVFKRAHTREAQDNQGGKDLKICPDCRTGELVQGLLHKASVDYWESKDLATHDLDRTERTDYPFGALLGGDPRGCVLKLKVPSGKTNDWGREGICVPVRER